MVTGNNNFDSENYRGDTMAAFDVEDETFLASVFKDAFPGKHSCLYLLTIYRLFEADRNFLLLNACLFEVYLYVGILWVLLVRMQTTCNRSRNFFTAVDI